jgi:hypothetical protein
MIEKVRSVDMAERSPYLRLQEFAAPLMLGGAGRKEAAMGDMVIVSYAPKAGHAAELERLVRDHVPRLRALGLASDRPNLMMRSRDGSFIEVFEWSAGAVARAHTIPEIHAM